MTKENQTSGKDGDDNRTYLEKNAVKAVEKTYDLYASMSFSSPKEQIKEKKETTPKYTLETLKPELQESLKKIQTSVKKENVDKLLNRNTEQNNQLFGTSDSSMSEEEKTALMKKLGKWEASAEINRANASVVSLWMENFGK